MFLRLNYNIFCPKYSSNSLGYFFKTRLVLFLVIPIPQRLPPTCSLSLVQGGSKQFFWTWGFENFEISIFILTVLKHKYLKIGATYEAQYTFRMFFYEERPFNGKEKVLKFSLARDIGEKCGNKQNHPVKIDSLFT